MSNVCIEENVFLFLYYALIHIQRSELTQTKLLGCVGIKDLARKKGKEKDKLDNSKI